MGVWHVDACWEYRKGVLKAEFVVVLSMTTVRAYAYLLVLVDSRLQMNGGET